MAFVDGRARVLISHPAIAGFGLNLQHCARMVFVGLGDSFEQYFQCLRRCWRFGQQREVKAWIILSEPERVIYENVRRKETQAAAMSEELIHYVAEFERAELDAAGRKDDYQPAQALALPRWL